MKVTRLRDMGAYVHPKFRDLTLPCESSPIKRCGCPCLHGLRGKTMKFFQSRDVSNYALHESRDLILLCKSHPVMTQGHLFLRRPRGDKLEVI